MIRTAALISFVMAFGWGEVGSTPAAAVTVTAQASASDMNRLEQRLDNVEAKAAASGVVLYLFGAFCALWAQNTQRNAWLWFFLGMFFSFITVIVLLYKNAQDLRSSGMP